MFRFPWGDMHSLNLGWFLQKFNELREDWATAEAGIDGALDAEIQKAEDALSDVFDARDAAAASATAAAGSASAANTSKTAAQNSATAAASSATLANQKATAAGLSEAAAAQSATAASNSASAAATSATQAGNSAAAAQSSAAAAAASDAHVEEIIEDATSEAVTNATAAAAQSATAAANSATAAAGSATAAAGSATAAAGSATAAEASAQRAEEVEESIPEDYSMLSNEVDEITETVITTARKVQNYTTLKPADGSVTSLQQSPTNEYAVYYAPIIKGSKYTIISFDTSTSYIYAFFNMRPYLNAPSYNGTRYAVADPNFIAPITGYVGFRSVMNQTDESISTTSAIDSTARQLGPIIAKVINSMEADTALVINDFRIVENTLYRITAPVASGASLIPGTNCTATTVADVLKLLLS